MKISIKQGFNSIKKEGVICVKTVMKTIFYLLPMLMLFIIGLIGLTGDHSAAAYSIQGGPHFHHQEFRPVYEVRHVYVRNAVPTLGFEWLTFIYKLVFITVGALLIGFGKLTKSLKITGVILLSLGVLWLLPNLLALPIILVIFYLLYKSIRAQDSSIEDLTLADLAGFHADIENPAKDFLDEWEKMVRKEEKGHNGNL